MKVAIAYKVAQVQGSDSIDDYVSLYESPEMTEAVISTIAVCNTSETPATYRIAITPNGVEPTSQYWLCYDAPVNPKDTVFLSIGGAVEAGKQIMVSGSDLTVTFTAFLSEITQ